MGLRASLLAGPVLALPTHALADAPPLHADFDAEPVDAAIATGGALLGQPITVDEGLSAIVRESVFATPSLELSHDAPGLARALRFEFVDAQEIAHGDLEIAFTFRADQLDFFSLVYVREQGGSAQSFLTMELHSTGDVLANDASGEPAAVVGHYVPGVGQRVLATFHLDAGTWDLAIDDVPAVTARAHGVHGRGIGGLLFGTHHQTAAGSLLHLDDVEVRRGDRILVDGFEQAITPVDGVEAPQ
ncbi:MAG: hypothetical protein EOP90_07550 [Lysobacteraceae bacterium]|nr:MAG: hypothetical protein EOP90_07550 [Xanthomonadaceae bacterium]